MQIRSAARPADHPGAELRNLELCWHTAAWLGDAGVAVGVATHGLAGARACLRSGATVMGKSKLLTRTTNDTNEYLSATHHVPTQFAPSFTRKEHTAALVHFTSTLCKLPAAPQHCAAAPNGSRPYRVQGSTFVPLTVAKFYSTWVDRQFYVLARTGGRLRQTCRFTAPTLAHCVEDASAATVSAPAQLAHRWVGGEQLGDVCASPLAQQMNRSSDTDSAFSCGRADGGADGSRNNDGELSRSGTGSALAGSTAPRVRGVCLPAAQRGSALLERTWALGHLTNLVLDSFVPCRWQLAESEAQGTARSIPPMLPRGAGAPSRDQQARRRVPGPSRRGGVSGRGLEIGMHIRRGDSCMRWAAPGDAADMMHARPCYRTRHYVAAARMLKAAYNTTCCLRVATDEEGVG